MRAPAPGGPASAGPRADAALRRTRERRSALPLVGRDAERAEIARLTARPERLRVAITGPAGIGKRRLLDELEDMLSSRGLRVVVVDPDPEGRTRIGGALRRLIVAALEIEAPPPTFTGSGSHAAALGARPEPSFEAFKAAAQRADLPDPDIAGLAFLSGFGEGAEGSRADDTTESLRVLAKVCGRRQLALICRDYDRLDALSRRAIDTMIEAADELPVAVSAAVAPPGGWSVLVLGPLSSTACSSLAEHALRGVRSAAEIGRVVDASQGLPLALLEAAALVRDGGSAAGPWPILDPSRATGELRGFGGGGRAAPSERTPIAIREVDGSPRSVRAPGDGTYRSSSLREGPISSRAPTPEAAAPRNTGEVRLEGPSSAVAEPLMARVARLDIEVVDVLHRAAVFGEIPIEGRPAGELAARGILVDRDGVYRFAHSELQRIVYAAIPSETRRRLHREAAELADRDPSLGAWVAAAHVARGGDAKRAVESWMDAALAARISGDFAVEGLALREALSHLRLAERLDELTHASYVETFAELATLLASAAVGGGDSLGASSLIREALFLQPSDATAARLWLRQAEIQAGAGSRMEAAKSARRAAAARTRGVDPIFDGELAVLTAELALVDLGIVEAIQRFVETLGTPSPDPIVEKWQLAGRLGKLYEDAGDNMTALAYHELALSAATRVGDEIGRASSYAALMRVHRQSGEFDLARRTGESAVEILSRVGDRRRTRDTLMELRQIAKQSDRTGAFKMEVDRRARTLATALGFAWMPESGFLHRTK